MCFVCVFEAVYVCVCAGQSTGSIVKAFETLLTYSPLFERSCLAALMKGVLSVVELETTRCIWIVWDGDESRLMIRNYHNWIATIFDVSVATFWSLQLSNIFAGPPQCFTVVAPKGLFQALTNVTATSAWPKKNVRWLSGIGRDFAISFPTAI